MINTIEEMERYFNAFNPSLSDRRLRDNRVHRMELLLDRIGNPQSTFESYHIAGSKGKGTTASYLAKLIEDSGCKCGLYMSPHVYDIRERFSDSTRFFQDDEYIATINELKERIEGFSLPEELGPEKPTTFELYTAYGYLLFKNTKCRKAVIETGLGGRLDATNTLNPSAVIFSNIELEHTELLGNTFEEIAREKLGILRKGVPTFTMQKRLFELIEREYPEHCDNLYLFDTFDIEKIARSGNISSYRENRNTSIKARTESKITLFDALYAYRIAHTLNIAGEGKEIDLTAVSLPARFEELQLKERNITFIIDGAHTPSSCKEVLESLIEKEKSKDNRVLIFSAAIGKKIREIGEETFSSFKSIIITGLGEYKRSSPDDIYAIAREILPNGDIEVIEDANSAVRRAIEKSNDSGYILSLGSFYLASRVKVALKEEGYVD